MYQEYMFKKFQKFIVFVSCNFIFLIQTQKIVVFGVLLRFLVVQNVLDLYHFLFCCGGMNFDGFIYCSLNLIQFIIEFICGKTDVMVDLSEKQYPESSKFSAMILF